MAWASKFTHKFDWRRLTSPQTIHYLKTIKEPRMEDYDFKYRYGNRFAFLGNGTVKAMVTKDITGLSPYVRNADTEWDIE